MAMRRTRREFLADVGCGVLIAGVGIHTAAELGLAAKEDGEGRLEFGGMEPLVRLMQETPPGKLNATLIGKMKEGVSLRELVAAGALANARTFGGEDYVGFHTMMALAPAYQMAARDAEGAEQALPVLKVLYRNTNRIQESGGRKHEVLQAGEPAASRGGHRGGELLRGGARGRTWTGPRRSSRRSRGRARAMRSTTLLVAVQDNTEVHRDRAAVPGVGHAGRGRPGAGAHAAAAVGAVLRAGRRTLRAAMSANEPRTVLPEVMEKYKLMDKPAGTQGGGRCVGRAAERRRSSSRRRARPPRRRRRRWRRDSRRTRGRGDLAGGEPVGAARRGPAAEVGIGRQAGRQRARRLDRRARVRLGQRLADIVQGGQCAEHVRVPDPRRVPGRDRPRAAAATS